MKSNHQPYEDWILSQTALNQEQREALQDHLRTCEACNQLSEAWMEVENQLHRAPMAAPESGFAHRWMARLEAENLRHLRRQTFLVMLFSVGGAVFLASILGIWFFPVLTHPVPVILAWVYEAIGVILSLNTYAEVVEILARTVFEVVPETVWLAIAGGFGILGALWIIAYQKLTSVRRASI
jgi:hypothetical protein